MKKQIFEKKNFRSKVRYLPLLLIFIGILAYANSFEDPFIFDDEPNILENPNVQQLWPLSKSMSAPLRSGLLGRPIVSLSLALNYAVSKYSVWSYHVVNLIIHLLAGLTLYGIVRRTLLTDRLKSQFGKHSAILALVIATIWVVHPIQTESVTYIIQRAESLMGLFYLLTLYLAILAMQSKRPVIWSFISAFCCGLGMLTKEVMITAPVIVLLYDRTFVTRSFVLALKRRWSLYTLLAVTWVPLALSMWLRPSSETIGFSAGISALDYTLNQFIVVVHYLRLCLWPSKLCLFYNWPIIKDFDKIVFPMLLILIMLGTTVWGLIRNRGWGFLGAWFFGILAPTSSFIPIKDLIFEHRVYLSLAGLIALIVMTIYILLCRISKRLYRNTANAEGGIIGKAEGYLGITLVIIIVAVLTLVTINRNNDYRSALSIWQSVIDVVPDNHRAYNNLGLAFKAQGKFDEAVRQHRKALSIEPYNSKTHYNLGLALSAQDKLDEAIIHYHRATQIKPDFMKAYFYLGATLQSQGKLDEAIRYYYQTLKIDPNYAPVHSNLGIAFQSQGKIEQAIVHYRKAIQLDPNFHQPYNNLAWILASHSDPKVRKEKEAIKFAEHAAELTGYQDAGTLDTLAVAQAAIGEFDQAVKTAEKAIEIAAKAKNNELVDDIRRKSQLYQQKKTYREPMQKLGIP